MRFDENNHPYREAPGDLAVADGAGVTLTVAIL